MFNKRESQEANPREPSPRPSSSHTGSAEPAAAGPSPAPAPRNGPVATIGPSIAIEGKLAGEEDFVVEGKFKGTIELKKNTLTIGASGSIDAEVYAHTILVDGTVNGDLYASERISIRKSARITGNILAPRIALEDGARFRGSIDMDTESEAFRKAFGGTAGSKPAAPPAAPAPSGSSTPQNAKSEASNAKPAAASGAKPGSGAHG